VDLQSKTPYPAIGHPTPATDVNYKNNVTHLAEKHCEAHSVYECSSNRYLVRFLHAVAFCPVRDTWIKAIRVGHFATWPGLTEDLVRTHLPKELATLKGHLSQRRKNLRSMTKITDIFNEITDDAPDPASTPTPSNIKTHNVFAALVDVGKIYGDLTVRFTVL
jgi:hypothetical protein